MSRVVVVLTAHGLSILRRFQTPQEAIEETFKEDIVTETSRKQRIKRIQMKKQAQKKPRTKKTAAAASTEVAWHVRVLELPLALFHTTIGPIIAHVEAINDPDARPFSLRLWAPAAIRMGFQPGQPGAFVAQYSVTFQPIALVETYLDLSSETPFGRSPVPEALVPAYADYFARVVAGEYSFTRVTAHVQQAAPHEAAVTTPAPQEPTESLPWTPGNDPHAWLARKVYRLGENETLERDDPRRVLVKRAFFGWAYEATADKVAEKFDFNADDVQRVYDVIHEEISNEDQAKVKAFLNPSEAKDSSVPDESALS